MFRDRAVTTSHVNEKKKRHATEKFNLNSLCTVQRSHASTRQSNSEVPFPLTRTCSVYSRAITKEEMRKFFPDARAGCARLLLLPNMFSGESSAGAAAKTGENTHAMIHHHSHPPPPCHLHILSHPNCLLNPRSSHPSEISVCMWCLDDLPSEGGL